MSFSNSVQSHSDGCLPSSFIQIQCHINELGKSKLIKYTFINIIVDILLFTDIICIRSYLNGFCILDVRGKGDNSAVEQMLYMQDPVPIHSSCCIFHWKTTLKNCSGLSTEIARASLCITASSHQDAGEAMVSQSTQYWSRCTNSLTCTELHILLRQVKILIFVLIERLEVKAKNSRTR